LKQVRTQLEALSLTPQEYARRGIAVNLDGQARSLFEILSRPDVSFDLLAGAFPDLMSVDPRVRELVETDARYDVYLKRQRCEVDRLKFAEHQAIPEGFDYGALPGLSNEVRQRLAVVRPKTLAHVLRIEGVTPAASTIILAALRSDRFAPRTKDCA
jgi:tRNA uridine 5-carboxymethylaminomethyl modification enzyme